MFKQDDSSVGKEMMATSLNNFSQVPLKNSSMDF